MSCTLREGVATSSSIYFDDVTLREMTLAEMFALAECKTNDVIARIKIAAYAPGTQIGVAIRVDALPPSAGVVAYFAGDGTIKADEFTGTTTWTNRVSAAKAFTANDEIILWASGAALRVYHRTAAGTVSLIGSTAACTILQGSYIGLFSTHAGNLVEEFEVFSAGTLGEYESVLNRFIQ